MTRKSVKLIECTVLFALTLSSLFGQQPNIIHVDLGIDQFNLNNPAVEPTAFLVQFYSKEDAEKSTFRGGTILHRFPSSNARIREKRGKDGVLDRLVSVEFKTNDPLRIQTQLQQHPLIKSVDIDYLVFTEETSPNDALQSNQWALNTIQATKAWDITTGDPNVVIAVVDTGIWGQHPDLTSNMWTNQNEIPDNNIDDDQNGFIDDVYGWDFADNDNNPTDDRYHGTHVAGIAGGTGNNNIGITGVAWNTKLMPVKIFSESGGAPHTIALQGLQYAAANGAHVVNSSWGSYRYVRAMHDFFLEQGQENNILFVASAGNDTTTYPHYPSNYDHVMSIASTTSSDRLSDFSNFGFLISLAAPGSNIYSSVTLAKDPTGYTYLNGTSMAAPQVSGAAALLLSLNNAFSRQDLDYCLQLGVDYIYDPFLYKGRLNLFKALQKCQNPLSHPQIVLKKPFIQDLDYGFDLKGSIEQLPGSSFYYYEVKILKPELVGHPVNSGYPWEHVHRSTTLPILSHVPASSMLRVPGFPGKEHILRVDLPVSGYIYRAYLTFIDELTKGNLDQDDDVDLDDWAQFVSLNCMENSCSEADFNNDNSINLKDIHHWWIEFGNHLD